MPLLLGNDRFNMQKGSGLLLNTFASLFASRFASLFASRFASLFASRFASTGSMMDTCTP